MTWSWSCWRPEAVLSSRVQRRCWVGSKNKEPLILTKNNIK